MNLLSSLWTRLAGIAAAIGAGLVVALSIYAKGRGDQKSKSETEDLRNAVDIRSKGEAARRDADAGLAAGKLRDDDGWRRD